MAGLGLEHLEEEVQSHALQAFLGLVCMSLITLPIAHYPLGGDRLHR